MIDEIKTSYQIDEIFLQTQMDQNRKHIYSCKSHANQQSNDIFLYSESGMTKYKILAKSLTFQIHTEIKFWRVLLKIPHGTSTTRKCSAI